MPSKAPAAEDTKNVLDMMTAEIMGRKTEAAAKLTPVKGEVTPTHVLPKTSAPFPNDVPQEAVLAALAVIETQMGYVADAVAAVRAALNVDTTAPVKLEDARKKKEREADEAAAARDAEEAIEERAAIQGEDDEPEQFDERLERLRQEAQAATFTKPGKAAIEAAIETVAAGGDAKEALLAAVEAGTAAEGWVCPKHGKFTVEMTRLKREYRACPDCGEHERL